MSDNFPSDREFLQGDSEMTLRTRQADWAATPLGDPATWPQSLKTVVRLMLSSRYAMWMGWGDDLRFFYNDAYRPTLGLKHDWALGAPAARVWAEIWPEVRPLIDEVLSTGRATWNEGLLLFLERSGVPEETYHTFSYSPLFDDHGRAEGLFCVVTEETQRVIAERRIASLGQVASTLAATQREQELIEALGRSLGANDKDLPFTLTYFFDDDAPNGRLVSATGFADGAVPAALRSPTLDAPWPWPLGDMLKTGAAVHVDTLDGRVPGEWPRGHWPAAPRAAVLLPIRVQGQERVAGCLVAGLNPYRPFDADYASFLDLLASQLGGALSNARAYEEAQRRAEALAQIDRAKTTFFSNVSHEFRTPLTLMLGPLEDLLGDASLVPAWQDRLLLIQRNGVRLQKLVNSLLDFSRIEAGRVQASYVPADLALLTAELASNFRSATEKAGLALDVDCVPIASGVYVDVDMWEKIVLNLLSNAFKFTFEGRIAVRLHEDDGQAVLEVEDTGTGIPPHELPRMFERFHRVEGSRGRSFEGSGIGLALVQELVRLHGGEISVASELDRGTTFTVRIPLGRQHLPAQQVVERAPSAPPGKDAAYVS
ncbi:MAG TPA: ATP-binding protein, partial [Rhizobacter sp.]